MSADGWSKCPQCGAGGDEYEGVREDYEFYLSTETGEAPTLEVRYEGNCKECGWNIIFEHSELLKIDVSVPLYIQPEEKCWVCKKTFLRKDMRFAQFGGKEKCLCENCWYA